MATVEIKRHVAKRKMPNGMLLEQDMGQDYVILQEVSYEDNGTERKHRVIAGYCDVTPGAPFRPIISGLPESILSQIKRELAERDAKATGKSVFDTFVRHVSNAPPAIGESELTETDAKDDDDDSGNEGDN